MAISDLLTEVGQPGSATTLSSPGKAIGASSINVGSTANWPAVGKTVYFGIRTVNPTSISTSNPSGLVTGTYTVWKGIVATNSLTNLTLQYGTDQVYAAGTNTQVFIPVDASRHNAIVAWGSLEHDLQGHHGAITPTSIVSSGAITGTTLTGTSIVNSGDLQLRSTSIETILGQNLFDHIISGCVLSGTGYGSTLGWSLTAGSVMIGGKTLSVSSASGTVSASKDTYFDLLDPGSGSVATLVNTAGNIVSNNAASPALAASSVRLGIIVSGTNIAAATSINQGQETMVLPIASSIPYTVTDSLGNLICPRDPLRKVLGYRQITSPFTTNATTAIQVTGLSSPVIIPSNRKVKITVVAPNNTSTAGSADILTVGVWDGTVGSGTQIQQSVSTVISSGYTNQGTTFIAVTTPSATSKTYNVSFMGNQAANHSINCSATNPATLLIELE